MMIMSEDRTTVVKTGSSNVGLIVLALAIIFAVGAGLMFYQSEQRKNDAVSSAASAVGDAAKSVTDTTKQ